MAGGTSAWIATGWSVLRFALRFEHSAKSQGELAQNTQGPRAELCQGAGPIPSIASLQSKHIANNIVVTIYSMLQLWTEVHFN